ncbi:BTAD domain-containing putative transcriptional regulator [Streptomyces sp. N2A]|uniref:AfsR/SARP family transcriptional regulator n=1 Tax=Streptomyces sp. N2A TaxID=3073936 RepID=UPI00286FE8FC|nr:BTAD domain-containing putative transcriptional regulator [Streptomyces sp. N2A]
MDIYVLGPICLGTEQRRIGLGSDKERCVLASLALSAGRPVALETLVDRLWDDTPPAKSRQSVHTYVSRVRRAIRTAGPDTAPRITQHAHTYTLAISPDRVDWHRFQRLTARARAQSAKGDDSAAAALLHEAEGLWDEEALAGLPGLWPERMRARMAEERLGAAISRIAAELRLRRFHGVLGPLSSLVGQHPHDEMLLEYLMLAYYGCGRHADALRVYQRARRRLREDLGADPSTELTRVHQHILRRAPLAELLGPPAVPRHTAKPAPAGPRNLPRHTTLVGRRTELRRLCAAIDDAAGAPGPGPGAVIALEAISGMAGVGKTAVAVAAAERLGERFPDAQLYLDLRTHAHVHEPLNAGAALAQLLRQLGTAPDAVPGEIEERSALWRTLMAQKRAVVILDDAGDTDQVRPLLPDRGSSSLVIITSRRHLAGLPGAHWLALDVLPPDDATALFRKFAGEERTHDDAAVHHVVRLCGYLPLAIEIAANRFNARPSWTLSTLRELLSRGPGRISELRDGYSEIARAFEMSYQTLTAPQQIIFRRLALHLGSEFGPHAAAALVDLPLPETERLLETLLHCHLLQEPTPHRYRFHDLLAEYARMLAFSEDTEEQRGASLRRLVDFYLRAADSADRLLYPRRLRLPPPEPHSALPPLPSLKNAEAAKDWLTTERANLLATERHARTHGPSDRAAILSHVLAGFLDAECHWTDTDRMQRRAVEHWEGVGDRHAMCLALLDLSGTHANTSRYPQAEAAARRALDLARTVGAPEAEAEALRGLGILQWHLGRNHEALSLHQETLGIHLRSGDTWARARCENNIAIALLFLGEHQDALQHFTHAIHNFRLAGDERNAGKCINNLGDLHMRTGNLEGARNSYEEALTIALTFGSLADQVTAQTNLAGLLLMSDDAHDLTSGLDMYQECLFTFCRLGDRRNEANALIGIGIGHHRLGRYPEAAGHHTRALELARDIGAAHEEAHALHRLGVAEAALGNLGEAAGHLEMSLALADRTQEREQQARSLDALAGVRLQEGRRETAQELWQYAFGIFQELDTSEAARIGRKLASLTETEPHPKRRHRSP